MFRDEVFKGNREQYNDKLRMLTEMAEEEKWTFSRIQAEDPYKILRNYIEHTYDRLLEETKLFETEDGENQCMNTGLLTAYHQEIIALFSKYHGQYDYTWYLVGFFKSSDRHVGALFPEIPPIADYTEEVRDLVYDRRLKIVVNKEHIIDDNLSRFENVGYNDKGLISALLDNAVETVKKKLVRNYKLALPFYYHNTETGEKRIQLLVPLYFAGAPVRLALVLDKRTSDLSEYYEAVTVLPVDWAYMDSRVIVKPEEEWARIVDEVEWNVEVCNDSDETQINTVK